MNVIKLLEGFIDQLMHLCDEQSKQHVRFFHSSMFTDKIYLGVTEDIRMYRLNDDKVLSWLRKKVDNMLSKFEQIPALANSVNEEPSRKDDSQKTGNFIPGKDMRKEISDTN